MVTASPHQRPSNNLAWTLTISFSSWARPACRDKSSDPLLVSDPSPDEPIMSDKTGVLFCFPQKVKPPKANISQPKGSMDVMA